MPPGTRGMSLRPPVRVANSPLYFPNIFLHVFLHFRTAAWKPLLSLWKPLWSILASIVDSFVKTEMQPSATGPYTSHNLSKPEVFQKGANTEPAYTQVRHVWKLFRPEVFASFLFAFKPEETLSRPNLVIGGGLRSGVLISFFCSGRPWSWNGAKAFPESFRERPRQILWFSL